MVAQQQANKLAQQQAGELSAGNSHIIPRILRSQPQADAIRQAQQAMIMSASGWRKIFAASGNEDDGGEEVSATDIMLTGLISLSFVDFLLAQLQKEPADIRLAVGCDSRPTGTILADAFMRPALAHNLNIDYLFIAAAPEIMAYAAQSKKIHAFAYISASHNPIGHNGFKFGLGGGGVLDPQLVHVLEEIFLSHLANSHSLARVYSIISKMEPDRMETIFAEYKTHKQKAIRCYQGFSEEVITDSSNAKQKTERLRNIQSTIHNRPLGILGELNGSARTLSIDRDFLECLGVKVTLMNSRPREITHGIIPEGPNLHLCRDALEKLHQQDPAYLLGYVPDNDGDRGNIVYIGRDKRAHTLEAQQVFALVALAESAWLEQSGQLERSGERGQMKAAIVVNGPTSMRIDEIARTFGIDCFRAEVGEANVSALARKLRNEGRLVRLMGEGSNGGSIIHPAAVRDPLNSLGSILKLIRSSSDTDGLFQIWCRHRALKYSPNFTLDDVIDSLPLYHSSSSSEDAAIMKIHSKDHIRLKAAWERFFLQDWQIRRSEIAEHWGLESWVEINTEGIETKTGFGPAYRSGKQQGGLKILFADATGEAQAYIWLRGSGTEAVFRLLADVRGSRPELERYLLQWQRSLLDRADHECARP